ncbi:hypothetical protein D9M68_959690 [compost metagenome]
MQICAARGSHPFRTQSQAGANEIAMAQHDALGETRRPARVENTGQVLITAHGIVQRLGLCQQGFVSVHASRYVTLPAVDHFAQRGRVAPDRLGERAKGLIHNQDGRTGIVQRVQDLRSGPARVTRI